MGWIGTRCLETYSLSPPLLTLNSTLPFGSCDCDSNCDSHCDCDCHTTPSKWKDVELPILLAILLQSYKRTVRVRFAQPFVAVIVGVECVTIMSPEPSTRTTPSGGILIAHYFVLIALLSNFCSNSPLCVCPQTVVPVLLLLLDVPIHRRVGKYRRRYRLRDVVRTTTRVHCLSP